MRGTETFLLGILCASVFAGASIANENIEFEIKILEMEPKLADLLEERLSAGGKKAAAVHQKLPDLIRGGKIKNVDTVRFRARSGQRAREGAEFRNADGFATKEGFFAEHDVVLSSDKAHIHANLHFERAAKDRDGAMVARESVTAFQIDLGTAEVIERFDRGGRAQLYLVKATMEGAKPAKGSKKRTSGVRTRAEIFKLRDAKAAAEAVAAKGKAGLAKAQAGDVVYAQGRKVLSGQRALGDEEILLPRKRRDPRGVRCETEVIVGRGQLDINAHVEFDPWEKGEIGGTAEAAGTVENGGVVLAQFGATPYVLAVQAAAQGDLIGKAPAGKVVVGKPAGKGKDGFYTATYPVPANFKRTLSGGKRHVRQQGELTITRDFTMKELLTAKGVDLPDGAQVIYQSSKLELLVRHNAEGHAAIVKLINGLGP